MGKFAKLFDLEGGEQVLVIKNEDDECVLNVSTHFEGVIATIKLTIKDESSVDSEIESFDYEKAVLFRGIIQKVIKGE